MTDVLYESEKVDSRTGRRFRWVNGFSKRDEALDEVRRVNAGEKHWEGSPGKVTAWIKGEKPEEETTMEETTETAKEEAKAELAGAGWGEAAAASAEAAAKEPEVLEAGTAERELPCLLSDEEKLALGQTLAQVHEDIDEEEDAAKASAAKHRDRLKDLYASASEKAGVLRAGQVDRRVACRIIHILELNQCRTIRNDTGEIVSERPLNYAERQGKLSFENTKGEDDTAGETDDAETDDADDEEGGGLDDGAQGDLEEQLDEALEGTEITKPAELAGDEPAPTAEPKKAKRSRKS